VATAICVGLGGTPPPMVQHDADMAAAHAAGSQADQTFIQNLALFFTCFFRQHLPIAEKTAQTNPALLQSAMHLLVSISRVDDQEVFKICLEYWNILTSDLYHTECQFQPPPQAALVLTPAALSTQASPRRQLYAPVLSKLRELLVCRMAKPEEVLIVEDENGEIVRETMKDSDAIMMYKTMRETLVYLTHLNYDDTENIMLEKLQYQVDGSQWSWHNLNTLCWAIGSISGAMSEEDEKRFLVTVIKDLLGLCEMKRGKDNKAVVASNIMYVVGQYPRFLRAHWKFLKTVVNKLFEFMHELHPGVQDMACDTFLKIAQKCRRKFVILQVPPPSCRRRVAPPPPPPPPPPLTSPTSPHRLSPRRRRWARRCPSSTSSASTCARSSLISSRRKSRPSTRRWGTWCRRRPTPPCATGCSTSSWNGPTRTGTRSSRRRSSRTVRAPLAPATTAPRCAPSPPSAPHASPPTPHDSPPAPPPPLPQASRSPTSRR
jgi:hypothetical protein